MFPIFDMQNFSAFTASSHVLCVSLLTAYIAWRRWGDSRLKLIVLGWHACCICRGRPDFLTSAACGDAKWFIVHAYSLIDWLIEIFVVIELLPWTCFMMYDGTLAVSRQIARAVVESACNGLFQQTPSGHMVCWWAGDPVIDFYGRTRHVLDVDQGVNASRGLCRYSYDTLSISQPLNLPCRRLQHLEGVVEHRTSKVWIDVRRLAEVRWIDDPWSHQRDYTERGR